MNLAAAERGAVLTMSPVQVKICCIRTPEEARTALSFGAAALGFVSEMPAGPGEIPEDEIRKIVDAVPPATGTFLLTAVTDPEELIRKAGCCGVNTLQLWDPLTETDYLRLRLELPGVSLVQAIHVLDDSAVQEAKQAARMVDALVLDSANPQVPHRWEEQTGRTHDWEISRAIVEAVTCPVLLAGGLTASNVGFAVAQVRPYGVDVCTGVRTANRLDTRKLVAFLEALRPSSR